MPRLIEPIPLRRPLSAVITLTTAALLGWTACSPPRSVRAESSQTAGLERAPDFTLKDADGRATQLSDYKGKVVLLDFWATWCGPCKIEIPWFEEFERKNKDRGFAVLGVAMDDEGWSAVKPFLKELNVNYRVLMGDDKTADLYHGIEALPTTILIDREGRIVSTHVGLTGKKEFEDVIERLLQEKQAASASSSGLRPPHDGVGGTGSESHDLRAAAAVH